MYTNLTPALADQRRRDRDTDLGRALAAHQGARPAPRSPRVLTGHLGRRSWTLVISPTRTA